MKPRTRVVPFIPDRFASTVAHYVRHRPRYPQTLVERLCREVDFGPADRALDLGCGPGTLTVALARRGAGEVIGFDPDPAMLAAARAEAAEAGLAIRYVEASSYDLSADLGPLKLVTMARSFHWMDRATTLKALDGIVVPGGAVAILSEQPQPALENGWKTIVREVRHDFLGAFTGGATRHHAAVLLDSAFDHLELHAVIERRRLTLDDIVGRAFSELESSPEALGQRADAFEAELRTRLLKQSPEGRFSEIIQFNALVARRSADLA